MDKEKPTKYVLFNSESSKKWNLYNNCFYLSLPLTTLLIILDGIAEWSYKAKFIVMAIVIVLELINLGVLNHLKNRVLLKDATERLSSGGK